MDELLHTTETMDVIANPCPNLSLSLLVKEAPDLKDPGSGSWVLQSLFNPDSKVHEVNMGPNWGRQDPGGPHVGPMNLAIWEFSVILNIWE